jgi:hypothetical protein
MTLENSSTISLEANLFNFSAESGETRLLSIPNASKETLESSVKTFKRIPLNRSQRFFYFTKPPGVGEAPRLLAQIKRFTCDLIT